MIIRIGYKKITGMEGSVSNDTSNRVETDESIKKNKKMIYKKEESIETSPLNKEFSPKMSGSSDTSDKESSNDNISIKSKEIINPAKYSSKCREIAIDSCDSLSQINDQYFVKVDNLRQDIQKVLSKWMMTVRDQVQDTFYENVRIAFDDFIQEIENYNNSIKKSPKKTHSKAPSTLCSSKKSKTTYKESKTEEKPQAKVFLGNSIEMVERINARLQHLIDMLSRFNISHNTHTSHKVTHKKDDNNTEKQQQKSHLKEIAVDEVVNHTIKKLKKYSKKHGLSSLKPKKPRTSSLKKSEPCISSEDWKSSHHSLKRQAKISPGDKLQFEMWLKSQTTSSDVPKCPKLKSSERTTTVEIKRSTESKK